MPKGGIWAGWVALVVLAAVAIYTIGGPMTARQDREDAARVQDLIWLKDAVNCHARQHSGELPLRLEDIADCGNLQIEDRITGQRYRYTPHDDRSFELCADFHDLSRLKDARRTTYLSRWINPATGCLDTAYTPN